MTKAQQLLETRLAISKGKAARNETQLQEAVAELLDAVLPPLSWTHPNPNTYRGLAGAFLGKTIRDTAIRTAVRLVPALRASIARIIKRMGAQGRKEGTRKGVPDVICWFTTLKAPHGFAIELKYGKNKAKPEQLMYLRMMEDCGMKTAVCRSMEQVVDFLITYGYAFEGGEE